MRRFVTIGVLFALVAFVFPALSASAATTAATAPPGAPNSVSATGGTLAATVSWQPSGQPATSFTVSSNPGAITASVDGTATSATVTGLGYGLSYTFSVIGTNSLGTGAASAPSNAVTPDPPGGPYHQGFAVPLFNRDISAGSPFATNLGDDPVHLPGISAVVLNLTASQASVSTAVQVVVSNQIVQTIWVAVGQVQSSLVVVAVPAQLSQSAIQVTAGRAHVELDFVGYHTGPKTLRNHSGQLVMISPATLLDTSVAAGSTTNIPVLGQGGIPSTGVAEVLLNVTASGAAVTGSFALLPSGGFLFGTTTLGFAAGQTTANRAIVAVPANGSISLVDRGAAASVRVDVLGWFTDGTDPSAIGGLYTPLASARLVDTAANGGPLSSSLTFAVLGQGGVPPLTSTAPPTSVLVQVTAVAPAGAGSIFISGTAVVVFAAGQTVSGLTLVHLASDGSASLTVTGAATNVTVDVVGYYSGDLIVPGSTKVLTPALLAAITGIGDDNSVTFAPGTLVSPFIQLNDVIAADVSPTTPQGFLFRVLSISTLPSGAVVLGTRIALLPEAVTAFTVDLVVATGSAQRFGARSNGAASLLDCVFKYPFPVPANTSIDPNCPTVAIANKDQALHLFPTPWADLALTDLEIQVIPHIHMEWNPFTNISLVKASVAFSEGVRIAFELSVTKDLVYLNNTLPLLDRTYELGPTFRFPIGPVPVTVTPTLTVAVTFEASISVGMTVAYHFDKYVQVGVSYDGSQFHTSRFDKVYVNGFDPPSFNANADAKLTVHIAPGITFYRFKFKLGPFTFQVNPLTAGVDFNRFWKASATVTCTVQPSCFPNPWWTLSYGECIGVFLNLDLILVKKFFSRDLACIENVLLAAKGPHIDVTITPPSATVARFKVQHFHATVSNSTSGVSWSVVGGAANGTLSNTLITTDVDYTAPGTAGIYTLNAAAIDDPSFVKTATITVLADPPGAPRGVTAAVAGPDSATVSWTAPSDDGGAPITAYHVLVSPGGAVIDTGNTLSVTVPGLAAGGTYTFQVTATNKAGTSAPSVASAPITLGASAPSPPTAVSAVPVIVSTPIGSALVSWTAPTSDGGSPITAYHVLVSLAGGQVDTSLQVDTGNTLSVTVPNLNAGSTYTFQVTATNQAGRTSVPSVASAPITIPIPDIVIVTPANFDYGLVTPGATRTQTLTVHAKSTVGISISSLLLLPGAGQPIDFAIPSAGDHCTGQLVPAGGTCTFDVVYTAAPQGFSFIQVLVYYDTPINVVSAMLRGHTPIPVAANFRPVTDAQMLDLQNGWTMDGFGMLATLDGGQTWTRQVAPAGTRFQSHFRFADASHGLALGCVFTTYCSGIDTKILGTSDGGATWTIVGTIPNLESRGIWVADALHGWVIGSGDSIAGPAMYATADGGLTWTRQVLPDPTQISCAAVGGLVSEDMSAVRFIDPLHGWAFGSSECQQSSTLTVLSQLTLAWSTSDGGVTWMAHDTGLNKFFIYQTSPLQVTSPTHMRILANVYPVVILSTDDGGATFRQISTPGLGGGVALSYRDSSNAVLVTSYYRHSGWITSDGGSTWTELPAFLPWETMNLGYPAIYYNLLETVDASHWWAFGEVVYGDGSPVAGVIEATANASTSWLTQLVGDGT